MIFRIGRQITCLPSSSLSIPSTTATELLPWPIALQHETDVLPTLISMKKSETIYKEYKLWSPLHISVSVLTRPCKEDKGELVGEDGWTVGRQHKAEGAREEGGFALIWSTAVGQNEREAGDWR